LINIPDIRSDPIDLRDQQNNTLGSVKLTFPPSGRDHTLVIGSPTKESLEAITNDEIRSSVVDLSLLSPEESFSARICLFVDDRSDDTDLDDLCLGFFDEIRKKWVCEDECLEEEEEEEEEEEKGRREGKSGSRLLCGTSDHFTSFAILFLGGSNVEGDRCGADERYFAGSVWNDSAIALGVTFGVVSSCVLIACFLLKTNIGLRIYYGSEGSRVQNMRTFAANAGSTRKRSPSFNTSISL